MTEGPLTQGQLDRMHCEVPGCTHQDHGSLFLVAKCHQRAGLTVQYDRARGTLRCACGKCRKFICEIEVGP